MKTMFRMKNIKTSLLTGALSVVALTSCVSENLDLGNTETGVLQLSVDIVQPQSRSLTEVTSYPVVIYDADGNVKFSYNSVSDVPATIRTGVGKYTAESHTPGGLEKQMSYPYYKGTKDFEILPNTKSEVEVTCTMQNSQIVVNYNGDFMDVFTSWEITLSDGEGAALSFTNTSSSAPVYYWFGEDGAEELTLNFRGTTADGSTVVARNTLTPSQASSGYDSDRENFCGGETLTLNFTPAESEDGKISSITINANVTFTETNETIDVDVVDKSNMDDPGNNPGDDPGNDPSNAKITLNLPQNMTVSAATDKSLGDTYIKCEDGIKSIKVNIVSTSGEMVESLNDLNTNYGVNFVAGAEIVDNQSMVQLFNDLNQPLSVPTQGAIDYTFPIGNFFGLLGFLSGQHTFNMVVEDMNGSKKSGVLVLTVE